MKKKGKIILILLIMVLVAVVGVEIYFIIKNQNDSNKKMGNLKKQIENLSNNNVNTNETEENNSNDSEISNDTSEYYETPKNAIKKALKDENWKKENLYMSREDNPNIDDPEEYDNDCRFIVCKRGDIPVVVVKVSSEEALYSKIVLITYENGNVKTECIGSGHIYHGGYAVDTKNSVVIVGYMHMGCVATYIYSVEDNKVEFKGGYECEQEWNEDEDTEEYIYSIYDKSIQDRQTVSKEKYDQYAKELNVSQYDGKTPEIELNDKNIDKYIK